MLVFSFSRYFSRKFFSFYCCGLYFFLLLTFSPYGSEALEDREALRRLPVQDSQEGRIKPFDTFSRELLQLIYGREEFKKVLSHKKVVSKPKSKSNKLLEEADDSPKVIKIEAVDIVMMWMLWPEEWENQKIFQIRHNGLREALGLEGERRVYFSPLEVINNPKVPLLMQELRSKRSSKEKLNPYFQAIQTLESQINMFMGVAGGVLPLVMPVSGKKTKEGESRYSVGDSSDKGHGESGLDGSGLDGSVTGTQHEWSDDRWLPFSKLQGEEAKAFHSIIDNFIGYATVHLAQKTEGVTYEEGDLRRALESFQSLAREKSPDNYARRDLINWEVQYETLQPFMWAWILYLVAVFFFVAFLIRERSFLYRAGSLFLGLGLLVHVYGIVLRVLIQQRPPVGTMYETVIWVPLVALICAIVLDWKKRRGFTLICGGLVSVLCLMISDLSPVILNDSMKPLEPVLLDNFWLLTHVVIIVSSYGAFFLSFALADVVLFYFLCGEDKYREQIKEGAQSIYRCIQVGFVLLTLGTILGGVWADYSWGRFWGGTPRRHGLLLL